MNAAARRNVYLLAAAGFLASAGVYLGMAQPASREASRLAAEVRQLSAEIAGMQAELARLERSTPPELPAARETSLRVRSISLRVPSGTGYSVRFDPPQTLQQQTAASTVVQARLAVSAEIPYQEAVSLLTDLAAMPASAVDSVSIARIRGQPDRIRLTVSAVMLFENDGSVSATVPQQTQGEQVPGPQGPPAPAAPRQTQGPSRGGLP